MYHMVKDHLTAEGLMVVQATSPYYAPKSFGQSIKRCRFQGLKPLPIMLMFPPLGSGGLSWAARIPPLRRQHNMIYL